MLTSLYFRVYPFREGSDRNGLRYTGFWLITLPDEARSISRKVVSLNKFVHDVINYFEQFGQKQLLGNACLVCACMKKGRYKNNQPTNKINTFLFTDFAISTAATDIEFCFKLPWYYSQTFRCNQKCCNLLHVSLI